MTIFFTTIFTTKALLSVAINVTFDLALQQRFTVLQQSHSSCLIKPLKRNHSGMLLKFRLNCLIFWKNMKIYLFWLIWNGLWLLMLWFLRQNSDQAKIGQNSPKYFLVFWLIKSEFLQQIFGNVTILMLQHWSQNNRLTTHCWLVL